MPIIYQKVRVTHVSFETLTELGVQMGDEGQQASESESKQSFDALMTILTTRQRQVAELMFAGYSRAEIAQRLQPPVVVQAVHQIVLRIRRRLVARGDVPADGWKRRHGQY